MVNLMVVDLFHGDRVTSFAKANDEKTVRHLPVIEDEAVVGIISIADLVKSVIDDQRFND